ncbi:yellowish-green 1-like protein [Thozetella sp. PMI_491]|nr:yellowish-green 1-like protein [Thozetella sp. PMI_491]
MASRPYHVQSSVDNPNSFPHHQSVSALWNSKWRKLATVGVYPFHDGKVEDFDPVFQKLIEANNDDYSVFYNPDKYAEPFIPAAEALIAEGRNAEQSGSKEKARELYLRAGTVCRIGRFPIVRSQLGQKLWELNKTAFLAASPYLSPPNTEVRIPFAHASTAAGESVSAVIPVYLRIPEGEPPAGSWPVLLFICGLDHYRTDFEQRSARHAKNGFACVIAEIPGTGDCPAAKNDPTSTDRLWSTVLDWIDTNKIQYRFDTNKIVARGMSTGGYNAMRIAHTHADRLLAVVAQGGGSHHMFDPEWIKAQNHMEYPYALADALAFKFGYESIDEYTADAKQRFSLLETGIFDKKSAKLMLINGMEDSIFPIEDSFLPLRHGRVKEARFLENREHVGNPGADDIIYEWCNELA